MSGDLKTNPEFKPNLQKSPLKVPHYRLIKMWDMDLRGTPIGAPDGRNAAVWFGKRISRLGEVPVLVALSDLEEPSICPSAAWFFGTDTPNSSEIDAESCAEAAQYAAPNEIEAINILGSYLPPTHYGD